MGVTYTSVRRKIAQEMDMWGGDASSGVAGQLTAVDPQGSLLVIIDTTRPEPDDDWDSSYIIFNPGQSFSASITPIWRRIADNGGFVNANGTFMLAAPLPSSQYTQVGMTYEIYKSFRPEQWMAAVNWAIRKSYTYRHRMIWWEVPEDAGTVFYDWGHMVGNLSITDPVGAPTVTAVANVSSVWPAATYKFGISYFNSVGQTLVSPVTTLALSAGQAPQFATFTLPEQATGAYYWATPAPGGSQLSRLTQGDATVATGAEAGAVAGLGSLDFTVPPVFFLAPPSRSTIIPPLYNTTAVDIANVTGIWRRTNPGQYPEKFIDLSPDRWRGVGGQTAEIKVYPNPNYNLRFWAMAPGQPVSSETDVIEQPEDILIEGAQWFLWDLLTATASAQNLASWESEVKKRSMAFKKACGEYKMEAPRRTMRRPFIKVGGMNGGWWN